MKSRVSASRCPTPEPAVRRAVQEWNHAKKLYAGFPPRE
jgi:hypothetical protein